MEPLNVIKGSTTDEIWEQIETDLIKDENEFDYHVLINQEGHQTDLDIDIDLGGGFESGYSATTLSCELPNHDGFKFAMHEDHFIDDIGKFLGLKHVKIGYPELDDHLVVKTNDEEKIREIFSNANVRAVIKKLSRFDFGILHREVDNEHTKQAFLELNVEEGIKDPVALKELYSAFYTVLNSL